ncbi:kelch repeat protein [Colletotrichum orchidophilum]|uniref:Kelch repeat protein n=1 Tax=Colletotrichum orchidophilum TaxID=1209926 RepID=A0A1G4AV99_9PEZI|nr:kelch repeat protein [Colletotrichum orchidophilum]OHE93099.1 kelch repeat protein [Colletotrichum orchidophilum]
MIATSLVEGALVGLVLQLSGFANAQSKRAWELSDAPSPEIFLRRTQARVAVLGGYAYIDGGEVSQLDARGNPIGPRSSNGVNSTLSIDLSTSWSASNVRIRELPKEPKATDLQALWINEATNTFWIWGGHRPYGDAIDEPTSWKFEADGKGGGLWSKETPANPTLFQELRRNEDGAFASTTDAGFWFGGQSSGWTTSNPYSQPVPGILSYNMTTKSWTNETSDAFSKYGTLTGGAAIYIPTFGPNGLITIMGGATWGLEPDQKKPIGWQDFSNLTFMDPVTKDWYWQKTTGNAPTPRRNLCSVGVEGNNGTYEIFVFGGTNTESGSTYDDVFVLSLPGFFWTQVPYESKNPRRSHCCAVVGRRQMLSVGGVDGKTGYSSADPWPQGLGLFDMTDWTWKTDYDAGAKEYESAKTVNEWYQATGVSSVQWSSNEIQALFRKSNSTITGGTSQDPSEKKDSKGSLPIAAIVGAVVGAVVGGFIGIALFCFIRRRKHKKTEGAIIPLAPDHARSDGSYTQAYYHPLAPGELHSDVPQLELYGGPIPKHEMWAEVPKPEMAATGVHHYTVTELDAQHALLGSENRDQSKYRLDLR